MRACTIHPFTDFVSQCASRACSRTPRRALHQVVLLQVELQNGVFDGSKDKSDVLCVGGTGEVRVDDLIAVWIQVHKHLEDKLSSCLGIPLWTCLRGEMMPHHYKCNGLYSAVETTPC